MNMETFLPSKLLFNMQIMFIYYYILNVYKMDAFLSFLQIKLSKETNFILVILLKNYLKINEITVFC